VVTGENITGTVTWAFGDSAGPLTLTIKSTCAGYTVHLKGTP
jgi:hypothetical protein